MNLFSFVASVNAPKGLWEILLRWINGPIGNLGWTLLLLTILVKLVTTPLDFMVKYTTKKQTLVQQKCAPQLAKLRKKFGNNEQAIRAQTASLYKREGLKMGTGCLMMAINMILTCVIFFTFYSSLRKVSAYEAINQYEQIQSAYTDAYYKGMADYSENEFATVEEAKTWVKTLEDLQDNNPESTELADMELFISSHEELFVFATEKACEAANKKWNNVNESWLWVNNIWVADATTRPFPSYENLTKTANNAGKYYKEYVAKNIDKTEYTTIANYISSSSSVKNNGYYILAILAGLITFAQQLIADFHTKLKNKKANKLAKATNKIAQWITVGVGVAALALVLTMPKKKS